MITQPPDVYLSNMESYVIIRYNEEEDEDWRHEISFDTLNLFIFRYVSKLLLYCFGTI